MNSFPHLADPLTDGGVILRDYVERDIPEILIAYQDDAQLHVHLMIDNAERPNEAPAMGERRARWGLG